MIVSAAVSIVSMVTIAAVRVTVMAIMLVAAVFVSVIMATVASKAGVPSSTMRAYGTRVVPAGARLRTIVRGVACSARALGPVWPLSVLVRRAVVT